METRLVNAQVLTDKPPTCSEPEAVLHFSNPSLIEDDPSAYCRWGDDGGNNLD